VLRIALPNKGALSEGAVTLAREAGYKVRRGDGDLIARDPEHHVEFFFLRPRDIAVYVADGTLQIGITGRDLAADSGARLEELMPLGFGGSTFRYAVPRASDLTPDRFDGLRIATSYPHIVRDDMARRGLDARVVELDGAVEISIQLGVADAVADVVQTGRTLEQAGLKTVGEPVLESEAVLIGRTREVLDHAGVRTFVERVRGIITARAYVLLDYVVEKDRLDAVRQLTPGIESPTVSPVNREGWVAVRVMAPRKGVNLLLDQLAQAGARAVLVSDIQTCRL
jgi:ATP phosphoribosyltransferase